MGTAGRLNPPHEPVTFTFDGERVVGERGESLAGALIAAGMWTVARSPKFHRPRGPACMRGACDGCLARVDGVPNVMTCLTAVDAGLEVTSQNTLGSRELDLLRVTDWFFPDGMNHHELFAGVPGVQAAMQLFARRVAGLGKLPEGVRGTAASKRRDVDVLVVGAGPAGMAMAIAAARAGRVVEVVDDALVAGGGARGLVDQDDPVLGGVRELFARAVAAGGVVLRSRAVAAGVFGRDVLVVSAEGEGRAEVLQAKALVIAAGAHDGIVPFENNDFPGVMSARAACILTQSGVSLGTDIVILTPDESATELPSVTFGAAFERSVVARGAKAAKTRITRVRTVIGVKGSSRLRAVVVPDANGERSVRADVLLVDAPRAPAYELCEQAGATLSHSPAGYAPVAVRGKIADGVFAIGEVTGAPLDPAAFVRAAEEIVAQLG